MDLVYYNPPYCEEDECGGGGSGLPAFTLDPDDFNAGAQARLQVTQDPEALDSSRLLTFSNATAEGGDYTITFDGDETATIPFNDTGSLADAALEALPAIGGDNVEANGGPSSGSLNISFVGDLGGQPITEVMTADASGLTGPDSPYTCIVTVDNVGQSGGPKVWAWLTGE